MYDRKCSKCDGLLIDSWEPINEPDRECGCGGVLERVHLPTNRGQVIGDEIDVEIRHALCHPDGTPRRFRSRAELRRAEIEAGYTNHVEHIGGRGSDKSKHTSRWI